MLESNINSLLKTCLNYTNKERLKYKKIEDNRQIQIKKYWIGIQWTGILY